METKQIHHFPELPAKTLAGRKITFPGNVQGGKALIVMVFEEDGRYEAAQNQATAWAAFWEEQLSSLCAFYEIAMMSGKYRPISFWIDSAMRSGLERDKHGKVACFYGDKAIYQNLLGIEDLSKAHVFLLDENGGVLFRTSGAADGEYKTRLLALLKTKQ